MGKAKDIIMGNAYSINKRKTTPANRFLNYYVSFKIVYEKTRSISGDEIIGYIPVRNAEAEYETDRPISSREAIKKMIKEITETVKDQSATHRVDHIEIYSFNLLGEVMSVLGSPSDTDFNYVGEFVLERAEAVD